jgi:hypothetical protein
MAGGCVMLNVCVVVQPLSPVTVHVYVPAQSAVADAPVPPEGAQAYVNGPVPEVIVTEAVPLHCPLHKTFVCVPVVVSVGGCVMLNVLVAVHPLSPVTVHV